MAHRQRERRAGGAPRGGGVRRWIGSIALPGTVLACAAGLLPPGCGGSDRSTTATSRAPSVLVPAGKLPDGWRLVPSSEMPPSDKMPWWRRNPQRLVGRELDAAREYLEVEGKDTKAVKFLAAMYAKGDEHNVMVFAFAYASAADAQAEYESIRKDSSPDSVCGYCRHDPNTVVFMGFSEACPDRDFFLEHFRAVTALPRKQ